MQNCRIDDILRNAVEDCKRGRAALSLLGTDLPAFHAVKLSGGSIAGAPLVLVAQASNRLVRFDANQIAYYDGGLEVERSDIDTLQMTDTPTPGATAVVRAFQTNAAIVRLIRYMHWLKLRDVLEGLPFAVADHIEQCHAVNALGAGLVGVPQGARAAPAGLTSARTNPALQR